MMGGIFKPGPVLGIVFALTLALTALCANVRAQAADCPAGKVCLTPEAMKYYLQQDDKAKAQEVEIRVLKEAIEGKDGYKSINTDLKVALAQRTGELTGCQQNNVDLRATNTELIKGYKARPKIGLINF